MNPRKTPTRRKEARQPVGGPSSMRRYALASLLVHAALVLTALARPGADPERPVYAEPIYAVALVSGEPNYEPPLPPAPSKPKPTPEKKKAPEPKKKDPEAAPQPKAKKTPQKPETTAAKAAPTKETPTPVNTAGSSPNAKGDAPVSMGVVDQSNFTHDYYLEILRRMLAQAWSPPAGGNGILRASVHLVIRRDGTIENPEIVTGSGWSLYDRSTVGAVLDVKKFPPLPEAYDGDELGLTVNFQRQGDEP